VNLAGVPGAVVGGDRAGARLRAEEGAAGERCVVLVGGRAAADEALGDQDALYDAQRALAAPFIVSDELSAALAATPGPVLLVDDYTDSGWTLAVGARLLRQARADQVLPLVLALAG
jgi:ATP-dependent DNA helicase RecQ